jgi:hypothetical protein
VYRDAQDAQKTDFFSELACVWESESPFFFIVDKKTIMKNLMIDDILSLMHIGSLDIIKNNLL